MTMSRRRFKQTDSLETRLRQFAEDMRRRAEGADGNVRKVMLERAANADKAIDLERHLRQ